MKVTKHFVTVGNRRVHYHRAGEGPVVALLHASPCSAKVLRLPLEVFAQRFTAIAFDTPGFGLSDLLPMEQPETEDLADALAETLTALGIEHAAAYGRHTGAQIAVEFAARYPQRCAMALTDGFPIFSAETKKARLEKYLAPIVPSFDGGHLVWLWFRYRDQHVFWPWNEQRLSHRADTDVPDPDFLHRGVIELLEAGDSYRVGYATAYRHRGLEALADLKVPVCFGARPGDNQLRTLQQFPPGTWTQEMPRDARAATQAELEILSKHPARERPPPAPACQPLPERTTTDYVDIRGAQILVRSSGKSEEPVVILHHAPGSSALYDDLVLAVGRKHGALAFDLPGQGESDPGDQTVEAWTEALLQLLDRLKLGAVHLYGHQGGAAVAVEAALRAPQRVRSLVLDEPMAVEEGIARRWLEGVEPVTPAWNGEHLLRVWHMRRDMELWFPWYDRRRENARTVEPRIDPARLTLEVREAMKQPASFAPAWRAVLRYPMQRRLAEVKQRVLLMTAGDKATAILRHIGGM
ncbi:MAG TPA: alpha/beta hydrolase [Burkholderiales bacterium]|nr:alpha/beta hydrolase [Burkholderiales bacterium]